MYLGKKGATFRIISVTMIFFFALSLVLPRGALAARNNAGGGEVAEFDFGKFALGSAVGVASSALGSAIGSGLGTLLDPGKDLAGVALEPSFMRGFTDSISNLSGVGSWTTNFVNNAAIGQVEYAIGMMGSYSGWDPKTTILVSSITGGIAGGGLNPGGFGSSIASRASGGAVTQTLGASINAFEGMGLGLIEGAVEGAILMSAADKKGNVEPWAGALAGLAGNLVKGSLVGGLSPTGEFSFGNIGGFKWDNAARGALNTTLKSIPSAGVSMGVQYITKNMDKQDAYIIRNAFSGLNYIVNTPTNYIVDRYIREPPKQQPVGLIINNQVLQLKQNLGSIPGTQSYNKPNIGTLNYDYIEKKR